MIRQCPELRHKIHNSLAHQLVERHQLKIESLADLMAIHESRGFGQLHDSINEEKSGFNFLGGNLKEWRLSSDKFHKTRLRNDLI